MFADDTSFARDFKNVEELKDILYRHSLKLVGGLINIVKTEFMIIGTPNGISKLDSDPSGIL